MPLGKGLEYTCVRCEQKFHPNHRFQKFCSRSCARHAEHESGSRKSLNQTGSGRKLNIVFECCVCRKEFHPSSKVQRCCSKSCARKFEYIEGGRKGFYWKGGKYTTKGGYVSVWVGKDYPGALKNGYMPEHRYVMQEHLGRPLLRTESVHHINGQRDDNRLENLQLRNSQWHGPGQALQCLDCGSQNIAHVPVNQNMVGI